MVDFAPPLLLEKYHLQGERGERDELNLSSHFQPIYSLAHRRPVGYEGLIRAVDSSSGRRVHPLELFSKAPQGEERIRLDRQCRALHVRNFQRFGNVRSWLFLNVDPQVASEGLRYGAFFLKMLQSNGFPTHRVAVELIETPFEGETRPGAAAEPSRKPRSLPLIHASRPGSSNFPPPPPRGPGR